MTESLPVTSTVTPTVTLTNTQTITPSNSSTPSVTPSVTNTQTVSLTQTTTPKPTNTVTTSVVLEVGVKARTIISFPCWIEQPRFFNVPDTTTEGQHFHSTVHTTLLHYAISNNTNHPYIYTLVDN